MILRKAFDIMGSRIGIAVAATFIALLALNALQSIQRTQSQYAEVRNIVSSARSTEVLVVATDLHMLWAAIRRASESGTTTSRVTRQMNDALRRIERSGTSLEARVKQIRSSSAFVDTGAVERQSAEISDALVDLVREGERLLNADITTSDLSALNQMTDDVVDQIRVLMQAIQWLEARILRHHSAALEHNSDVLTVVLGALSLIALSSLLLMRAEMLARRARLEAEEQAQFLAYHDSLTELPNRTRFHEIGSAHLAASRQVALILIDLDGLKDINDRFGQSAGDKVLRTLGQRIAREAAENRGHGARLSGDEFAILLPSDNTDFLCRFCEGLLDLLAQPVTLDGLTVRQTASIGLATASQIAIAKALDLDILTRVADFALIAAKSEGFGRYMLYDSDLELEFTHRRNMVEDLPRAIAREEFDVYLQPKVNLRTRTTLAFEALVRWRRNGSLVPPQEFIELAERYGHIKALDLWMLRAATAILADWNRDHDTDFGVSVNISALHLMDDADTSVLIDAIRDNPLQPELLTLEITETVQLADWRRVSAAISQLRRTGCRISIDDFGTGYSSLAYLRAIPADELKIDKSLVSEIEGSSESQFILDAVIDLAHSLDMIVVVEGIERDEQVPVLHDLGCQCGQGYLFGRPEPAEEALARATPSERRAARLVAFTGAAFAPSDAGPAAASGVAADMRKN